MLALVVAIAKAQSKLDALWTFLMLFGFIAIMALLVRPLLASWANRRFTIFYFRLLMHLDNLVPMLDMLL